MLEYRQREPLEPSTPNNLKNLATKKKKYTLNFKTKGILYIKFHVCIVNIEYGDVVIFIR